jgi:hypothetical protein
MLTDAFVNFRRVPLDPAEDGRVIHVEPALAHHLFDIPVRELVATAPSDAQKYDGWLEVTPFERGFVLFQEYDSRAVIFKQEGEL